MGVKGGRGPGLQMERLHVGAVLHLVALVVVDQGLVQRQAPTAVHQVAFRAAQFIGHRALNPGARPRLWADHINYLQVPLVACLHLSINREKLGVRYCIEHDSTDIALHSNNTDRSQQTVKEIEKR